MNTNIRSAGLKAWQYVRETNSTSEDALNRIAIENGIVSYTYGEMFEQWDKYAATFSALRMTESYHARVGLLGSTSAEAIFAFYGLNMTGAEVSIIPVYTSFSIEKVSATIKNEMLTDIILTDDYAQPAFITSLISKKKELGLNNILVIHVPVGGNSVNGLITAAQKYKHLVDRLAIAPICMDALLELYGDSPIEYSSSEESDSSIILHTSGTTSGTGKPIPLSDAAFNSIGGVYQILEKRYPELENNIVCGVTIDLSNSYSMVNQVHGSLSLGGTLAMVPGCAMNPEFYKSIPEFGQTLLFVTAAFIEIWMRSADKKQLDFSSLKLLVLGGSFVSTADKHRYCDFFKEYGAEELKIINGYGLTELGGACLLSGEDLDDESIGYPMPGVEMRLYDEDQKKFLTAEDAPCSGILYLRSNLMTEGMLDGNEVVKTHTIDGTKYICTNDIVSIDKSGKCFFLGRASRYFINDNGVKYESGKVEVAVSRQEGIEACVVVPLYLKLIHDNIPMLCVKAVDEAGSGKETVRKALLKVFKAGKILPADQLPHRVLITDDLPRNQNGKVDVFRIMRGEADGSQYAVKPVRIGPKIMDIILEPVSDENEKEAILQNAYKTIAKDLMESNNPINNNNNNINNRMEEKFMKQMNPYEFFKEMNAKQTETFKKMFENNPYCQGYKDYYEKQVEAFKNCQEKQAEAFKRIYENCKPDVDRIKEYNEMLKEYSEKMHKMSIDIFKDINEENKKFAEAFFGMVKEDAEKKSPVKKAAAKKATEKKPATKKATAKKTAAKKEETKPVEE